MPETPLQSDPPSLAVNDLAAAYQPRRVWAAVLSITWNLALAVLLLTGGRAWKLYTLLTRAAISHGLPHHGAGPIYIVVLFLGYAVLNYPIDLWFGYLEERQFGLAKDGVRAWSRDWLAGIIQHGLLFCCGSTLLLTLQICFPAHWLIYTSVMILTLFVLTTCFSLHLLPRGLFEVQPVELPERARLGALVPGATLPPVYVFSAPHLRDFSGGLIGLGSRQALLVSRSTLTAASDGLLRFVLLHDLGHRRYHHLLLSTLIGWFWVTLGLCVAHPLIARYSDAVVGHAPYIAWLALIFSLWMGIGEPALAYAGRRLEYQADRYYLSHGGTLAEMSASLEELSHRNLARTEQLQRRHTMFHPLPSVWNRLHAAREFLDRQESLTRRSH